jgi:Family of unknown function (DUF5990)
MPEESEITMRIILVSPPSGIDFALQKGGGNNYETIQTQRSDGGDLTFEFPVRVKLEESKIPNFLGHFAQGTRDERFVYIDIGTYAGQHTHWSRRLKVPLKSITSEMLAEIESGENRILETKVPGTGRDGGPNCATVKPFAGWKIIENSPQTSPMETNNIA